MAKKMVVERGLSMKAYENRYVPDLSLPAFDRLVVEAGMWRDGVVDDARRAFVAGGGDESEFKPPRPRRPRLEGNEGGVGGRVYNEIMRQRGLKIKGKVVPKRSAGDLKRLAQAMGFAPETEWWNLDEALEGLVVDLGTWRDGVVDDARQAWVNGGGDLAKFVPPPPRRPRQKDNEGGVGVRVYYEIERQRGTLKSRGKVVPKRSAGDLKRLAQAMGFAPETEWWNLDEALEGLVGDLGAWRDGVVDDARQAWVNGGGDLAKFVPPEPRRPSEGR
jgi:hypothetical protein